MLTKTPSFAIKQEVFNNDHRIVSKAGSSSGKFHFVASEAGDHKICFMPSSTSGRPAWLSTSSPNGGIKLKLDMVIGSSSEIESSDKNTIADITTRVKDLNNRLNDIRREQVFQRVSGYTLLQVVKRVANTSINRNARPSSEISPSPPTPVSFDG